MREEVLRFIARFTDNGKRNEVIDAFTNGCCYWFAKVLYDRFCVKEYPDWFNDTTAIVYAEVDNHFGCRIDDRVYDITGDVTDRYDWVEWGYLPLRDSSLYDIIKRDCINF